MSLDWNNIGDKLMVMLLGGLGTWLLTTVRDLRKDMDAAFHKIRSLERELAYDDAGTNAVVKRD